MDSITVLLLISLFVSKHFLCDFLLQWKYQYSNKHIFGHPGGILHAGIHSVGTIIVLFQLPLSTVLILGLSLLDGIIHYFVDYGKMNINKFYGWGPTTHEQFWWLTGFDQYAHYLTYILIIYILI
ncbi:MAG: DUF3307 domain-containing protein [Hydrotalea sp. AMD]|uniref:DUF3307 domain-containing protein n=1 Tax=Hydrotalea sp. AMD TaxID=2501297 RepID=UPI001027EB26|nr:DUF3307 domain-containing protein [Hydrotalea sp. AMD]RWZ87197.1 MAG: DUF3307 domain-containing protein [Hydrotalea sp. AMD]